MTDSIILIAILCKKLYLWQWDYWQPKLNAEYIYSAIMFFVVQHDWTGCYNLLFCFKASCSFFINVKNFSNEVNLKILEQSFISILLTFPISSHINLTLYDFISTLIVFSVIIKRAALENFLFHLNEKLNGVLIGYNLFCVLWKSKNYLYWVS